MDGYIFKRYAWLINSMVTPACMSILLEESSLNALPSLCVEAQLNTFPIKFEDRRWPFEIFLKLIVLDKTNSIIRIKSTKKDDQKDTINKS